MFHSECETCSLCRIACTGILEGHSASKLSDLKDINAEKVILLLIVNWFVGNFRGKVPIECYID